MDWWLQPRAGFGRMFNGFLWYTVGAWIVTWTSSDDYSNNNDDDDDDDDDNDIDDDDQDDDDDYNNKDALFFLELDEPIFCVSVINSKPDSQPDPSTVALLNDRLLNSLVKSREKCRVPLQLIVFSIGPRWSFRSTVQLLLQFFIYLFIYLFKSTWINAESASFAVCSSR